MSEEDGIRKTLAEYCHAVDDGRFEAWSRLFCLDAVLKGNGETVATGRDGILEWVVNADPPRSGGKHLTLNSIIAVDGDRATVTSDWIYLSRSPKGPVLEFTGRYVDELVREPDRWRFAVRDVVFLLEWLPDAAKVPDAPGEEAARK